MADLCGGHPADVLIAVLPGNIAAHRARGGEVAVLPGGWAGGKQGQADRPGLETERLRRTGEEACVYQKYGWSRLSSTVHVKYTSDFKDVV